MDPVNLTVLAGKINPMILPYLPYLLKGVKKASVITIAIGRKIGEVECDTLILRKKSAFLCVSAKTCHF